MGEEIITIGKTNPHVYPELELWGWPIALYLFLGGLAAGLIFFSSYFYLKGKQEEWTVTVKKAVLFAPVALIVGLLALMVDLHNPLYAWRLFTTFNVEAPMSWGAWTLLIITPLSIAWGFAFLPDLYPQWASWIKGTFAEKATSWIKTKMKPIAYIQMFLAIVLGIYTGILLSAFNARPLWNTSVLGFVFLVSGLSTAAVVILWLSRNTEERKTMGMLDAGLIIIEIGLLIHMFMGLLAGPESSVMAAQLFLFGKYAVWFWVVVVLLGLVLPLIMEFYDLKTHKVPTYLIAISVLVGGLAFRLVITGAGQWISYIQ